MTPVGDKGKSPLQEWRIWPVLTACTGTQLAYAVQHAALKDSFACALTLFSFIGGLCCVVSRRSQVVCANLLLQVVAFSTLFIGCCLGTNTMRMWRDNKKLAPLIVSQIIFFAALLLLNTILLALKRRHHKQGTVEEAPSSGKLAGTHGGSTERTASEYPEYPSPSRIFYMLHQEREEEQAQSEQTQNKQMHSCRSLASTGAEKACRDGRHQIRPSGSQGFAQRDLRLGYSNDISGGSQGSSEPLCECETEDDEAAHPVGGGRATPAHVRDRFVGSPRLVIRGQQIETAGGSQQHSAPERSIALQRLAASSGHTSRCAGTPYIQQQSCTVHGRAAYAVSAREGRVSGTRGASQRVDGRATASGPPAEAAAVPASGGVGAYVVDYEGQQGAHVPALLCATTPRRCQDGRETASCPSPARTAVICPFTSAPLLHGCASLHGRAAGAAAAPAEQGEPSLLPPSASSHRYARANIRTFAHRCWESTLGYMSQTVECDAVAGAPRETARAALSNDMLAGTMSSREAADNAAQQEHPQGETLSLYGRRRVSVNNRRRSTDASDFEQRNPCTQARDKRNALDGRAGAVEMSKEEHAVVTQHGPAAAENVLGETTQENAGEGPPPALPLEGTLHLIQSMQPHKETLPFAESDSVVGQQPDPNANRISEEAQTQQGAGHVRITSGCITRDRQSFAKREEPQQADSAALVQCSVTDELDAESQDCNGGAVVGPSCKPAKVTPSTKEAERDMRNEDLRADSAIACEGTDAADDKQRASRFWKTGAGEHLRGCTPHSTEAGALSDDGAALQTRNVPVFATPLESAINSAKPKGDAECPTAHLEHADDRSARCEAINSRHVLSSAFIAGMDGTFQGAPTQLKAGVALPLSDSSEKPPVGTVSVSDGHRGAVTSPVQTAGGRTPLLRASAVRDPSRPPTGNCSPELAAALGEPFSPKTKAASIMVDRRAPREQGNKPKDEELCPADDGSHHATATESGLLSSEGASPGCDTAQSAEEENHSGSRVEGRDKETAAKECSSAGRALGKTESEETIEGPKTLRLTAGVRCLSASAAEEATGTTTSEPFSRSWGNMGDAKYSVGRAIAAVGTAAGARIEKRPLSFPTRDAVVTENSALYGQSRVSREKVVYSENLRRKLTSNTTPRDEGEEDSWEDESDATERRAHEGMLHRKESDRGSESEWELSDLSVDDAPSGKERHERGTQKHQKGRGTHSAESPIVSARSSARKKGRLCRRSR